MICMYCGAVSIDTPVFVVLKAVKPEGMSLRWESIGLCCEACEEEGEATVIEYEEPKS